MDQAEIEELKRLAGLAGQELAPYVRGLLLQALQRSRPEPAKA